MFGTLSFAISTLSPQWEALLLLRANPGGAWDVNKIAKRLYTSDKEIAELLAQLCQDGLLSVNDGVFHIEALRQNGATSSIAWRRFIRGI
jgi:DNA-binding GntR family transcriptional regulator